MTLAQAVLPPVAPARRLLLAVAGSVLVALAAQISVPMYPVPMSLQTMAVSLVGLSFGWRLAGWTLLAYLAEGAAGLPVFANAGAGSAYLIGPTGGFLVGFVAQAVLTGWLAERLGRGALRLFVAALVPAMLLYVPGVLWLAGVTPLDIAVAAKAGAAPFVLGDVVKSAIAALAVAGGWAALRRRR